MPIRNTGNPASSSLAEEYGLEDFSFNLNQGVAGQTVDDELNAYLAEQAHANVDIIKYWQVSGFDK